MASADRNPFDVFDGEASDPAPITTGEYMSGLTPPEPVAPLGESSVTVPKTLHEENANPFDAFDEEPKVEKGPLAEELDSNGFFDNAKALFTGKQATPPADARGTGPFGMPVPESKPAPRSFEQVAAKKAFSVPDDGYDAMSGDLMRRQVDALPETDIKKKIIQGLTDPQQYVEAGKGVVPGAIQFAGSSIRGAVAAEPERGLASGVDKYMPDLERVPGMTDDELTDLYVRVDQETVDLSSLLQGAITELRSGRATIDDVKKQFPPPTPIEETTLYKAGKAVGDFGAKLIPAAPGYEQSVGRTLGEGAGSMISGIALSYVNPAASAVAFSTAGSGEAIDRAVAYDKQDRANGGKGLTQEQILGAGVMGIGPGVTDSAPIELLLGRLRLPPQFAKVLASKIAKIGGQTFIEGFQEGGQQYLQNLIEGTYDPTQSSTEGVLPNTAAGGALGAAAETLHLALNGWAGRRGGHAKAPAGTQEARLNTGTKTDATAPSAPEAAAPAETALTPPAATETPAESVSPGVSAAEPPAELSAIADQLAKAAEGLDEETAGPALTKLAAAQRNRKAKSPEAAAKAATAAADRAAAVAKGAAAPAAAPSLEDIGAMIRQATPDQRAKAAKVAGKAGALGKTMADIAAEQAGGQSAVDRVAGRGGRTAEVSTPETVAPAETPQKRIAFEQELSSLKSKAKVAAWADRNGYEVSDEEMDLPTGELKKLVLERLAPAQAEVSATETAPIATEPAETVAKPDQAPAVAANAELTPAEGVQFRTAKGSTYAVQADGTTVRNKKLRNDPGHEGDQGIKSKSDLTVYVTKEDVNKLGEFQAIGDSKKSIVRRGNQIGIRYVDGKGAGKFERRTLTDFQTEPAVGLIPVETWKDGTVVHFGNEIVEVVAPKATAPAANETLQSPNVSDRLQEPKPAKRSTLGKRLSDITAEQSGGQSAVNRVAGLFTESSGQTSLVPDVTSKDRLQAEANKPLKGGNAPTDFGLFGSESAQSDMLDLIKAQPEAKAKAGETAQRAASRVAGKSLRSGVRKVASEFKRKPVSLSRFIIDRGGMQDPTGDLRSMDGHKRPGLIAKKGMKPDDMRAAAVEAGYLQEGPADQPAITTVADLYDLLREDLAGRNVIPAEDREYVRNRDAALADAEHVDQMLAKHEDVIVGFFEENDLPFNLTPAETLRAAEMIDDGADVDSTIERIYIDSVEDREIADVSAEPGQATSTGQESASQSGAAVGPAREAALSPDSGQPGKDGGDAALRSRFYDLLEGKAKRSDWAKELGVSEADLAPLIKEALSTEVNWLREQNKGIFRVAKAKRGPRPAFDVAMDEIGQAAKAAPPTVDAAAGGKGKATLSSEIKARHKYRDDIARGNSVNVPPKTAKAILKAVKPHMEIFPKGVEVGALRYVDPADEGKAIGTFEMTDGSFREIVLDRDTFESVRAFRDPVTGNVFIVRFGDFAAHNFETLFGELRHEHVHVLRSGQIGPRGDLWSRLVSHAKSLDLLDMDVGTYLQMVGSDTGRNAKPESLLDRYTKLYGTRRDFAEIMDQEHVAHFRELAYHNQLLPEQIAPVQDILDIMDSGIFGRAAETLEPDDPLYALAQQATDLSKLGYYSLALRAARDLKQAKGTAEQMLAQLKTAGVKDSEIKATGLDRFLSDKKSVTRDEITSYLAAHAVEVREVSYGGGISTAFATPEEAGRMLAEQRGWSGPVEVQLSGRDLGIDLGYYRVLGNGQELGAVTRQDGKFYVGGENIKTTPAKWSEYALDGSNPTYSETVLHLPPAPFEDYDTYLYGPNDFRSGHWSEPNVLSHVRSSLQKDASGNSVFLIDELQSDWGQRVRDGGARDEAKIDDLKKRLKEKLGEHASAARMALSIGENLKREGKLSGPWSNADVARLSPEFAEVSRLNAELLTAESAVTSHPLVSTTDQWVQTSLRRILMKAVEAGADAVSFTPGNVQAARYSLGGKVDEIMWAETDVGGELHGQRKGDNVFYKDGLTAENLPEYVGKSVAEKLLAATPEADGFRRVSGVDLEMGGEGMRATYDSIYPKTLAKILGKFDKSIKPDHRKLNSSAGKPLADKAGKEIDFITFPLTEEAKAKIAEGLPLFALSASRPPLDMSPEARKERAEALGFDTSVVFYRGDDRARDSVRTSPDYGAVYTSMDPEVANGAVLATKQLLDERTPVPEGSVVIPMWGKTAGLYDYRNPEHRARLEKALTPLIDPWAPNAVALTADDLKRTIESGYYGTLEKPAVREVLKSLGFTGYHAQEYLGQHASSTAFFNPADLRSTNAAFDPALDGENGLLYSLGASRPSLDMSPEARKARAEEMGFDTSFVAYRGMKGEYSDSVAGSLDYQFFARDPSVASEYAENGVVVPVWLRLGRGLTINARGQPFYGIDPRSLPLDIHRTAREIADEIAKKSRSQPTIDAEVLARAAKASGYESLTIRNVIDNFDLNNEKRSTIHVVFSPSNIRSTNAAFDPALDGENGLLYAIGGPLAKTAPKASLAVAERMETRKGTPETIQRATGWFRGPDGKWRWEIDDSKAQVKNLDKNLQVPARSLFRKATGMPAKTQPKWAKGPVKLATNIALKDILDHAALFKAYPFLEKMRVNMIIGEGVPAEKEKAALVFRKEGGQLVFSPIVVRAKTTKDILPILLHEVQHYIQIKEGFAGGSSPSTNTAPPTGKLDFSKSGEQVSYKGRTFSADTKRNQATTGSRGPAAEDWSNVASKTIPLTRAEQLALRIAEAHTELTAPHPADYPLSPKDRRETIQDQISRDQAEMVHLLTVGPQDYADSIGEKESRAVEARLRMSPDERKGAPVDYGDVTGLGQSTINFADAANETLRRAELTKTLVDIKRRKRIDVAPGIVARHAWHDADWLQFSVDFKKGQDGYTFSAAIDPDSGRALVELADLGYDDGLGWPTEDGDGRKRPMPMVRLNEALDAVETYLRSLNLTPVHDPRLYPATAPQGKVDAELNDAELEQWRSYRPEGKSNRYDYGAPVEAKPDENVSDAEFAFWKKRDPYYRLDDARSMKGGEDVVVMPGDLATAGLDPAIWKARMSDDHYLSSAQLIIKMSEAQKELRKKLAEGASSEEANAFARRISDMQADYTLALAREKDAPIELSADQLVSREDDGGGLLYAIGAPLEQKVPKPLLEIMADLKDTTGTTTTQQLYGLSVFVRDARDRLRQVLRLKPNSRGMAAEVTGQYDRAGGLTRMRSSGDIATLTHEAAHHLETTFGDALAGLMGSHKAELEPLASPGGDVLSEGFAEWFSVYVRDPETARIEAPEFYQAFEEFLDAENPGMLEGLQQVQADYAEYLTADPVARGTANVQTSAPAGLIERTARAMGGVTQTLDLVGRTASNWFLDRAHPVRAVVKTMLKLADANGVRDTNGRRISLKAWENPYKIARMIPGGYKSGHMSIIKGVPEYGTFDISGPSLQDAVAFAIGSRRKEDWTRQSLDRFGLYLIARRAMAEHDRYTGKLQNLKTLAQTSEQAKAMRSAANDAATRLAAQVETRQRKLVANRARVRQIDQELKLSERRLSDLSAVQQTIEGLPSDRITRVAGLRSETVSYISRYREERATLSADIATTETELSERQDRLDMLRNSIDGLDQVIEANAVETKRIDKTGPNRPPTREPRAYYAQIKASLDQQFPQYAEAAKMVAEWQRRLLKFERDAGRWSEEAYQGLLERSEWYVPFMRKMDDLDTEGSISPKNKSNIRKFQQAKRFKGSDRDIINPIESMMERAYSTGMASMFNNMIGSLANLAERVGPGGRAIAERVSRTETVSGTPDVFEQLRQQAIALGMDEYEATMLIQRFEQDFSDTDLSLVWAPDRVGPGKVLTLPLWEDGKRNAVRLNDPKFSQDLFDAMQGLSHQQLNLVTRIMGAPARLLSRGVVSHPAFAIPNIVRDALASAFVTGAPPFWTQAKGIYYELGESTLGSKLLRSLGVTPPTIASTYQAAGGIMGGQMSATMSDLKDKVAIEELRRRGFHFANWKKGANPVSDHNWLQVASEISETATRLGVFAHALKRAKRLDPTMSDFDAIREAAFTARDVMDFDRRGSKMLSLAHIIAFLNPALQGVSVATRTTRAQSDRGSAFMELGRIYWRNERGETLSTNDRAALVTAGKMMMFASIFAVLVLIIDLLQKDDDEYKEIQETTSSRDIPVKIGGQWIRIPKPFEFALPANMLIAGVDYYRGKDPRLVSRWVDQFKDNVLPPAAPQVMTLVGGYMYNTDAFGNDIVNMGEQRLPAVMQFDNYTSQLAIEMSLAADRVGVPLSPEMIDFTLTTAGGYWGKDIKLASDQMAGRESQSIQDKFLIGPLTSRLSINLNRSSAGRSEFWTLMGQSGGEYTAAAAGYKKVVESGASALMSPERYLSRLSPEEQAYAILKTKFEGDGKTQRYHPLERAKKTMEHMRDVAKEIIISNGVTDGSIKVSKGETPEIIPIGPAHGAEIRDILGRMQMMEAANSLIAIGHDQWATRKPFDTQLVWDELRASSPEVADELERRIEKDGIEDYAVIAKAWPSLRDTLLKNSSDLSKADMKAELLTSP